MRMQVDDDADPGPVEQRAFEEGSHFRLAFCDPSARCCLRQTASEVLDHFALVAQILNAFTKRDGAGSLPPLRPPGYGGPNTREPPLPIVIHRRYCEYIAQVAVSSFYHLILSPKIRRRRSPKGR